MSTDSSIITFKAIFNFVKALSEVFTDDQFKPLKLYNHLLSKTTISHEKAIENHINAFTSFCISNRECILNRQVKGFKIKKIIYSDRVYIDMCKILNISDSETIDTIWKHLLIIAALVDPSSKALTVLKSRQEKTSDTQEFGFLQDVISKVESNVDPNANPVEAMNSIMNSGIFSELMTGMSNSIQSGNMDLGKLLGTAQGLLGGEAGGGGTGGLDMSSVMNMMGPMVNNMVNNIPPPAQTPLQSSGPGTSSDSSIHEIE